MRQATAQLGLADAEFNVLPPGDETTRARVRGLYGEVQAILSKHKINSENPLAQELLSHVENQVALLDLGVNALGSGTIISVQVENDARRFLEQARERLKIAQDVSLYNVDQKATGSPNVRILSVEIDLIGLTPPGGGITVFLTHRGNFLVRDEATFFESEDLLPDPADFAQARQAFREGRNLTVKGVTFITASAQTHSDSTGK